MLGLLADPTRLSIIATLRMQGGPVCVCDSLAAYGLAQPTISHHMGKLRRAGLVTAQKQGLWTCYQIATPLPSLVEAVVASFEHVTHIPRQAPSASRSELEVPTR